MTFNQLAKRQFGMRLVNPGDIYVSGQHIIEIKDIGQDRVNFATFDHNQYPHGIRSWTNIYNSAFEQIIKQYEHVIQGE